MKKIFAALCLFACVGFAATAKKTAASKFLTKGSVSFSEQMEKKSVMDAIVYVLSEHSMGVAMINESFGLIQSEWAQTSDTADNIGKTLALGMLGGGNTYFHEYLRIDFKVTENGYTVSPHYRQEQQKSNKFLNSSVTAVDKAPLAKSDEAKITMKIVEEINALLKIDSQAIWE
ncbi:MAG: hypothetical protein IKN82_08815 [Treponema sp.]|nr:hypothetical protein [Treponema sp.]